MARKPIVAGQFYPSSFEELNKQIDDCFESKFGPGALPIRKREKEILGIISPHAGYAYSGACAAWAYKEIAESRFADLYIILGLSHSGFGSCLSLEDWETPFGLVQTDKEFGRRLIKKGIKQDEKAHAQEHSIEVQLPFLQFVNKDYLKQLKIIPIIASPDMDYKEMAKKIIEVVKEMKIRVCVIASSDFTHFGLNYSYFPFKDNIKENMYKLDKEAIGHIKELDAYKFLSYIDKTGATICGKYPIAVMLEACKLLGAKEAKLLHYYTSGDIVGDYGSAVGYGAIVIK